jgi:serine/threonine-protein kinase HipA
MTQPAADLYQRQKLVATVTRTGAGYRFDLVDNLARGQLSSTLPAEKFPFDAAELPPFFLNLLPEGARLQMLLDTAKASDDTLELLLRVGWDTVGDVAVVRHGALPEPLERDRIDDPRQVSFRELFEARSLRDASIAGVQEKLSDATIVFVVGNRSAGPSLLKLNPAAFPRLVQDEHFFLRVASSCGIAAAKATLIEDRDGEAGLLVHRFDRVRRRQIVEKLHQEDACQLLDLVPARKYTPTMRTVTERIQEVATAPIAESRRLLELYIFSYLIGNGDLHAKNISLLWNGVVSLTPAYDVLSTLPYPELSRNMALPLEGKDANFRLRDFVDFGERSGVPKKAVESMAAKLCDRLAPWIGRLDEIGYDAETTEAMRREMSKRLARLEA